MSGRLFRQLRRDQQGTAIVELALAAPILACIIMGAVDIGTAFSRKLAMEQGAQRAVEKVMQTTQLKTVQGTIADEVSNQADVREDQVTVTFPRYCGTRLMADVARDPDTGLAEGEACLGTEKEAHYIMVAVTDEYDPIFPFLGMGQKLANGNYRIEVQAGMRTK